MREQEIAASIFAVGIGIVVAMAICGGLWVDRQFHLDIYKICLEHNQTNCAYPGSKP